MVRLLLEDVTLLQQQEVITAQVRFKGGATETITVAVSRGRRHSPQLLALLDQLLEDYTDAGVAEQLNHRGWRTFNGKPFDAKQVLSLRRDHQLKNHGTRLRERGLLTADEAASAYGVCRETIMAYAEGVQYATKSFLSGRCGGQTWGVIPRHKRSRRSGEGKSRPDTPPTRRGSRSKVI